MSEGGTIRIQAENCRHKDPATNGNRELNQDKYVRITIKDQGVGIPAELQDKIFDPYFSTKQRGTQKGMGLGLTTAYSIIDKHNGHMEIRSIENRGTTVEVSLPAAASVQPVKTFTVETNKLSSISTKGKFILLMDDEKMIIDLARELLKRLRYRTVFALHGAEAIELFKKSLAGGRPFDAVILDLTIKRGISGLQTLKQILKLAPNTRVIISSGYSNDPVMMAPKSHGFVAALPKPYTMKELQAVLSDVIGKK
ncbi:MAG: response regulator [Deltaproteobacteria bacterium]|nr:response regulator [Deltaproteobacteria bacterium]